jgi:hypothetical protein
MLLFAKLARAESQGGIDKPVAESDRSGEVAFGVGNHLGLGRIDGSPVRLQDLSGGGTTLELAAGYRLAPDVLLGVYVTGSKLTGQDTQGDKPIVYTSSGGLQVNWHARPDMLLDPWLGFGMGWRGTWLRRDIGGGTSQGIDVARVQAGLDLRFSSSFALAPVIGADWSLEVWDDGLAMTDQSNGARVNAFIFAGALARLQVF